MRSGLSVCLAVATVTGHAQVSDPWKTEPGPALLADRLLASDESYFSSSGMSTFTLS
jgi:hypothetical protein